MIDELKKLLKDEDDAVVVDLDEYVLEGEIREEIVEDIDELEDGSETDSSGFDESPSG